MYLKLLDRRFCFHAVDTDWNGHAWVQSNYNQITKKRDVILDLLISLDSKMPFRQLIALNIVMFRGLHDAEYHNAVNLILKWQNDINLKVHCQAMWLLSWSEN